MKSADIINFIVEKTNEAALFRFTAEGFEVMFQGYPYPVMELKGCLLNVDGEEYDIDVLGDQEIEYALDLKLDEVILYLTEEENDFIDDISITKADLIRALENVPEDATVRMNIVNFDGTGSCDCPAQLVYDSANNDFLISNIWEADEILEKTGKEDRTCLE